MPTPEGNLRSKVAFSFQYSGPAVANGMMDVRDLAPALLALGNLCDQANFELNGGDARASIQVKAFAPGSFVVELVLGIALLKQISDKLGFDPIREAQEVLGLTKDVIDLARAIRGRRVRAVDDANDGKKTMIFEHNDALEVKDPVYRLITRRPVQDDLRNIVNPLRHEGVDCLRISGPDDSAVEKISSDELASFDSLPSLLPSIEEEVIETTSTIEKAYVVVTLSSDPRQLWRLSDGQSTLKVRVDDRHLHEAANEGHLGIEPGFIVKVRVRSETRFVDGEPRTENHLIKILSVRPPGPRDDGSNRLL